MAKSGNVFVSQPQKTIKTWKLEAPSKHPNQTNFWHCSIIEDEQESRALLKRYIVQARWGRVGYQGNYSIRRFMTYEAALDYALNRIHDKVRKNYYIVDRESSEVSEVALPGQLVDVEPVSEWDLF